jgi:putative transposase
MNLVSTACILTAVARAMAIAGRGHVVVVAPPGGFNGSTGNAVNSALILGLRTSISALRDELRPHGVQISILYPVGGKTITHSQAVSGAPDFDSINSPLYAEKVADAFLRTVRRPKLEVSVSCARTFLARLRDVVSARWRGLCAVRPRVDHNGAVTCPRKFLHLELESGHQRTDGMRRKQFSEEQIIGILKEAEAGAVVTELCRKHGMSSATYYAWKAKYGGLEISEAKRLRALEDENAKLKRLLADTMLDNAGLKDLLSKKW